MRLHEALAAPRRVTVEDTAALQTDTVSEFARETLAAARAALAPRGDRFDDLRRRLAAWDGAALRTHEEPLVFNAWMRRLQILLTQALVGDDATLGGLAWRDRPHLVRLALAGDPRLCGAIDCRRAVEESLREAVDAIAGRFGTDVDSWIWGRAHRADFVHPVFARVKPLDRLLAFELPTEGDNFTVNRGTPGDRASLTDFPHVHGPGLRAIYDLADLDNSRFMIAPGQSGNPLSPHWGDLAERWASRGYRTLAPRCSPSPSAGAASASGW